MTSVSIIVPCRNESRGILRFIESVLTQDLSDLDCELIIADGMSDDDTREVLEHMLRHNAAVLPVKVIDNPGRIVSTGLNAAIRAARGEVIIRMDAHTEYAPDYIQCCVRVLQETGADNVGGPWQARGRGIVGTGIAAAFRSQFCVGRGRAHDSLYEGPLDTVYLGCWRRSLFDRVGLFDPALVRNQDDEFNLRLTRASGRVWQSPRIVSRYQPRNSLRKLFQQYFQYGFWKVAVIRKHRLPASWRHVVPGIFVLANLVLPLAAFASFKFGAANLAWCSTALWISEVLAYAMASLAASVRTASREGWRLLPILPVVFLTYHISYGAGFLIGIGYFSVRPVHRDGTFPAIFSELSR